jgi:PhoD-like phosphatase
MMLTVRMLVADFMDSLPVPDCSVTLETQVIAGWSPLDTEPPGPNSPPPPPHGHDILYDEGRSKRRTVQATTDAAGHALLAVDLDGDYASVSALHGPQHSTGGTTPDYIEIRLRAKAVDVHGLALQGRTWFHTVEDPNAELPVVLIVDPARSIVGDTTNEHATLWFQLHAPPTGDQFVCEVSPAGSTAERRLAVSFPSSSPHTATVTANGLAPATAHSYRLLQVKADGRSYLLTQGRFRTLATNPARMQIAFGSCHKPSNTAPNSLGRWRALARRDDIDLNFLIGDQIYGDGIETMFPSADWDQRYALRYTQLWSYQPMRDALRSQPTYMVLDDHEITDDWGVDQTIGSDRIAAGLRAFRTFQQAHNPGGAGVTNFDFHFRRGPAAFYFTDSRTARGKESAFPIMGRAQFDRMRQWKDSPEVSDADIVIVVVPVPPAILPINELEDLAGHLAAPVGGAAGGLLGVIAGAVIGGVVGAIVGGPAGAAAGVVTGIEIGGAVGAFAGAVGTDIYYEHLEDTILEPDIRDAWTYDKNLPDLVRLMDLLYDIANDVRTPNGPPGPHPRAVFILSGDYHFAAIHNVFSKRSRHQINPVMTQVTSSPISTGPTDGEKLVRWASVVTSHDRFALDPQHYESQFVSHMSERNFGRMSFERVGTTGRRYRFQIFVEGETQALVQLFDLDLDTRPVTRHDLIGDLLSARGRISLLRVHDPGGGFGPTTDRIDGEVIVQLESEPSRAFGFQLRRDANLPVRRRMLALLRDAFAHDRPVEIDYLRTGPLNGQLIRATELPAPQPATGRPTLVLRSAP